MSKNRVKYVCSECGYETIKWIGKCPDCGSFNTFSEKAEQPVARKKTPSSKALKLGDIEPIKSERMPTNIKELDRVLGGGILRGSLTLIGGDPGIGKSTLLLQICNSVSECTENILYVSGEESAHQIKLRAERISIDTDKLYVLSETNMGIIESTALYMKPDILILDSIQTMYIEDLPSTPGSVAQIRECTSRIMHFGKEHSISVIIVGHVTKDGAIAGPKLLEHIVDTVLYFEGERLASYRILRSVKNRFGSTNEIGVFEMRENGLVEIENPSEYMLSGRPVEEPGSAVMCGVEGSRALLAEIQALVCRTSFNMPRRTSTGMDLSRVLIVIAVLEKRIGFKLSEYDIYVNIAGGIKISEPASDLSLAAAIISSYKGKSLPCDMAVFGEIGLTGEIRAVSMCEKRVNECTKLGFRTIVLPNENAREFKNMKDVRIVPVSGVIDLLRVVF